MRLWHLLKACRSTLRWRRKSWPRLVPCSKTSFRSTTFATGKITFPTWRNTLDKDNLDRLPLLDKATAEVLKDELVDMKDNHAYQLVLGRLEARHQRDLRLLVREADTRSLGKLQGRVE